MTPKRLATYGFLAILILLLGAVGMSHLVGYPVLIGYVESGSMEPTLNKGDGFVSVPTVLTGPPAVGDVVVFQSESLHGGEITTHRIVADRTEGYVTQGDANPVTDQSGGEPLVTEGQVKAVALTAGGDVVRIPHIGTAAGAISAAIGSVDQTLTQRLGTEQIGSQRAALALLIVGLIAFAASFRGSERRDRSRSDTRSRFSGQTGVVDTQYLFAGGIALVCLGATVGMLAPAGTETIGIVSSEGDSANPTIIPAGGSDSYDKAVRNNGFVPTVSYFEPRSGGISIQPEAVRLSRAEEATVTVTMEAPEEIGYYTRTMTEYRYLTVLPLSVIEPLYRTHPWLPYLAINVLLASILVAVWMAVRVPRTVRLRERKRTRSGHR